MNRMHPHEREPIPVMPVVTNPKEFMRLYGERSRGDLPGYFGLPTRYRSRFQVGGGTGMPAGVPSPREMEMQGLAQKIFPRQAMAGSPLLSGAGKQEVPKPVQPKAARVNSEPVGEWVRRREEVPVSPAAAVDNFGLPSAEEVRMGSALKRMKEGWMQQQQQKQQQQQQWQGLQDELVELGIPQHNARGYAIAGEENMPENLLERLNNYRKDVRLARLHPDFDPTKPAKDQLALNDDHSFRTTVLRGQKGLTSTNNTTQNFAAEALTGGGEGFANFVFDFYKRGIKPIKERGWRGVPEAVGNVGWDIMNMATAGGGGFTNKILNKVASRGLPEASLAMERQLLQSWRPPMGNMNEVKMGDADKAVLVGKYAGAAGRQGEGLVDDAADEAAFFDKYALEPGVDKLAEKAEKGVLDNLDDATLKDIKEAFLKRMPLAKDHLDDVFNDPEKLKNFISRWSPELDRALLKDKLQKLPLDELKNYFKGRKLDVGSPNKGGEPWNFGTTGSSSNRMRGPYSSKAVEEDPWLRDMFGGNTNKVIEQQELYDFLLRPVTHQRMGGEIRLTPFRKGGNVPVMPVVGIQGLEGLGPSARSFSYSYGEASG